MADDPEINYRNQLKQKLILSSRDEEKLTQIEKKCVKRQREELKNRGGLEMSELQNNWDIEKELKMLKNGKDFFVAWENKWVNIEEQWSIMNEKGLKKNCEELESQKDVTIDSVNYKLDGLREEELERRSIIINR